MRWNGFADFSFTIELGSADLSTREILIRFALHNANHIGEISSQKGTQGLKGYSF